MKKKIFTMLAALVLQLGFEAGAQDRVRHEPPAEVKVALKECFAASGVTVAENQRPDPQSLSEEQKAAIAQCMTEKGFDPPPPHPHQHRETPESTSSQ